MEPPPGGESGEACRVGGDQEGGGETHRPGERQSQDPRQGCPDEGRLIGEREALKGSTRGTEVGKETRTRERLQGKRKTQT